MERVLTLLAERNKYIQKFYELNCKELNRLRAGIFDNVEEFYETRGHLLDVIQNLEEILEDELPESSVVLNDSVKRKIEIMLQTKDDNINKILEQDLKILSIIEGEKTRIIRDLQTIRSGKKVIGSYKSGEKRGRYSEKG